MPSKLRDNAVKYLLRQLAVTAPSNDPIDRPTFYKYLLTSQRFMSYLLDPTRKKSIRLFLRQNDVVFDIAVFGLINCGQVFEYSKAIAVIKLFCPECIELVLIGRNLHPTDLRRFLNQLKVIVPNFTTSHHRHLARSVTHLQAIVLDTLYDKFKRVEVFENQLSYIHRSPNVLDKCVVNCKSAPGQGQLALALKTKTKALVGRYSILEFLNCGRCTVQPAIEELQLDSDDAPWNVFCEPDSITFFEFLQQHLPNLRRLIFALHNKNNERWSMNCVNDIIMQVVNFKRSAFLNKNHDVREFCRTQIYSTLERAKKQGIQLFLCYDRPMFSIHDNCNFVPI